MIASVPFVQSMHDAAVRGRLPGSGLAWLDAARAEALQAFAARGLPDQRNELWKYTSLRALAQKAYAAGDPQASRRAVDVALLPHAVLRGPRAVFVNGLFRADLSQLDALPDGATVQSLAAALHEAPEPLRFLLDKRADDDDDGFTLLNRALAADGLILKVAPGVEVGEPLHIVHVGSAADTATAFHVRSLVEVGEGARLRIVEHHAGEAQTGHLTNIVRDIGVHENAHLDWTIVQQAGADATLLRRSRVRLHDDATLDLHALELGGKLVRHEIRAELAGARSRFESRGAFVLHGRQHADMEVLVTHRGRDSISNAVWRGVASDRARGVVHGRILVQPGADGADGSFYNKNLLLSPDAEIDTRPALEIYADEVKANHGATVGQLDENVLFYLRSRGVPMEMARRILVRAFCLVALDGMEPAPLREHCEALLAEQLPEVSA
ncbi:MAG TPA: Fe-S cluster assembly protein SufD [Rhodanobacteraceae bacterium]|nr:Fe-S cluster assembly protein SufD [Rhodanobacteraceae bacterium]